jgi:hypothetical protein
VHSSIASGQGSFLLLPSPALCRSVFPRVPLAHAGDQEEEGLDRAEHGEGDSDDRTTHAPPAAGTRAGVTAVPNVGPDRFEPDESNKMFVMAVIPPDR